MRNLRKIFVASSLIVTVTLGSLVVARGAEIVWRKSYGDAVAESTQTKKPLLVQFKAGWCHSCVKMSRQTMAEAGVAEYVNSAYIPLLIDADESPDLVSSFKVETLPASLIVAPNLKILARWEGYRTVIDFMRELTQICPKQTAVPVNIPL